MKPVSKLRRSERGSVLVAALGFAVVLAIILASHLSLGRNVLTLSNRSFYANAALDLAETGLEHAVWALNMANKGTAGAWDGWTTNGNDKSRKFENFNLGQAASGEVNVYVRDYNSASPEVIAKATVALGGNGSVIEKWVKVTVGNTPGVGEVQPDPRRGLFAYGLLARDSIYANGGAWMDSYKSDHDDNPDTPPVPWSPSVQRDNARVAVTSKSAGALHIDGADIYGTAAVGSSTSAGLKMKDWDGQIGPRGATYSGKYRVSEGALSVDFSASFETVTVPTDATVVANYTVPYSWDDPSTAWNDNIYVSGRPWDNPKAPKPVLGADGQRTVIQMNKLTVQGDGLLTIKGDVTLYLPLADVETMAVVGSGQIELAPGATFRIITPGNIKVSGAGIMNSGAPANVQIWSTAQEGSSQTITLEGSGALSAVLYAPNAALMLPGHTDFSGAAVVKSARLTGSGAFHYDESLEYFTGRATPGEEEENSGGGGNTGGAVGKLIIESFTELNTPTARAPYLALLSF